MKKMRTALLGTTFLAGSLIASAAFAQQTPTATGSDATEVTEIVVTGSRIKRDPATSPTPLIQVGREELLASGMGNMIDQLATIPALSNSLVPSDTTGSGLGDGGLALANLRSLGTSRVLTLVDGRRHVGSSGGSLAVDVDTIPRLLIQNVEIVTGGASSIYGADAVSGVLNFILRKDFEGAEIDANYAWINQDGQESKRISALVGKNFLDERLNVYAHAEYEMVDEVKPSDIDWIMRSNVILGVDADPTSALVGPNFDGLTDFELYSGVVRLDRPRWGSLTLANTQLPSALNNPLIPFANCAAVNSGNCYGATPGKTYWFDGDAARLANFGTRVGGTGVNRPYNIGGDGEAPGEFSTGSWYPRSESQRYQVGTSFQATDSVRLFAEAKYVKENTQDTSQPTFFDVYLSDNYTGANETNYIIGSSAFILRYSDNAFLPSNVKDAIRDNMVTNYTAPTNTEAGTPLAPVNVQWARHAMFGPDRMQNNDRELMRFVVGAEGRYDEVGFIKNFGWDFGYTYGQAETRNEEFALDVLRFNLAADAVVDTAGLLGTPGGIVCRAQLIAAQTPGGLVEDWNLGGDLRDTAGGQAALNECTPLNIFGKGNQSQEALDYVRAMVYVTEKNVQHDAVASVSGQLWDFWGAGPLGVALGAEYRKETTEGIGRDASTGDRWLFLNGGPDLPEVGYESKELFAELSVPLFRDSFLGQYAELSGSYRWSDYTTVGEADVYGVNLVYRPISDITFKTSFNTSVRVPTLSENFDPYGETFWNNVVDPCATSSINAAALESDIRANRIANCTALATAKGLSYDFAGTTATGEDDYAPVYTSGISGVSGGNPFLQPEESESFTFSVVLQPRFLPRLTLHADYYEIQIDNVIASVGAATVAANCVSGPSLNSAACDTIFRNVAPVANASTVQERSEAFKIGAPQGDPVGGFIEGAINYAKRNVRGLDFGGRYSIDSEEVFGRNFGRFDYSVNGSWLIEQKNFNNLEDPGDYTEYASSVYYPRVRLTSRLSWMPSDEWTVTWITDWQSSQDITQYRSFVLNADDRPVEYLRTGNFARNDLSVRWKARDDLTVRAGITNIFDEEQAPWLGTTLYSNFDPYGRRFNIGLNYTPW